MLMHLVSIFMEEDLLPGEKFQFTLNVQLEASQFDFSNVSPEDLCIIEWTIISWRHIWPRIREAQVNLDQVIPPSLPPPTT